MFVCSRIIVLESLTLHVSLHRLWISLLIEFSSKTIKQNTTKNKFIRYLCFIAVDFFHSCHHRPQMSFGPGMTAVTFKFSILSNIPDLSDILRIDEKFIHQLSAMCTCRDNKVGELSSRASKMWYKPPGAVYIALHGERLDQSDCWKLFVQVWNYTNC